jgi:PAS domain S-box-containing protein
MSTATPPDDNSAPPVISDRDIIESAVDFGVIATDMNGRIRRWNAGATRMFGWTAEEMLGEPASRFFIPEDNAAGCPETEMEQALLYGRSSDERWHVRKNGERFWASGEFMPLKNAAGQSIGYLKVLSDRTNQKLAATDVLQQNRNLEKEVAVNTAARDLIWNNSPDLLLIIGFDGAFRDVNPAWASILGWTRAELLGTHFQALVHPDDLPAAHQALRVAAIGVLPNFEVRYRHKDHSYRWILWAAAPEAESIYAIGKDISKERAHFEALQRSEEALRQAQKMEAIGQLTGGLAHDFNNLLAGITGNLEILKLRVARGNFEGAPRYIDAAMAVTNRAAALTHRLLAFARRQTLDPKPTEINHLAQEKTELLQQTLGAGVFLETVQTSETLTVLCDGHQLENALLNLAINSRDAMPHGGRLTIETASTTLGHDSKGPYPDAKPGRYVRISVRDTGVGMAPDVLQRALDPFFTTKPIGQGTGLGLSMVYGFVKQSRGYLHIDSRPDGGTSVDILLPLVNNMPEHAEKAGNVLEFPQAPRKVSILLVEDEESVRKVASEILSDLGYAVTEAGDAREAFRQLDTMKFLDLLVTDVGLPNGINGRQLADAIRETKPHLNVLFITGFADVAVTGHELSAGGMQILTKPFSMAAFAAKVSSIVGGN